MTDLSKNINNLHKPTHSRQKTLENGHNAYDRHLARLLGFVSGVAFKSKTADDRIKWLCAPLLAKVTIN